MIAVDTSALMAVLMAETGAEAVARVLAEADGLCMSAGTLSEAMIVADRRNIGVELRQLVQDLGIEVVALTASGAEAVAAAFRTWGKGLHPAGLNFGDCFAYALAKERDCPLLFVGEDFGKTDLAAA